MSSRRHGEERWSARLAAVATLVLGLGLVALGAIWDGPPAPDVAAATEAEPGTRASAAPTASGPGEPPARLRIPAIEVDEGLTELGLTPDRAMEVPRGKAYDLPGWYVHGPRPGELGPAVVGGHVDSWDGPSVFHELGLLTPGDEVEVGYPDGTLVRFEVERVESHAKDAFPFDEVFGDTGDAQLRLVTCGGAFDRGARSYEDNLVVFASLAGVDGGP